MHPEPIARIGALLEHYRDRAGLTNAAWSEECGIDRSTLGKICAGEVKAPQHAVKKLLASLGLSTEERGELEGLFELVARNSRRVVPTSENPVSQMLIRVLAVAANIDPEEVRELWTTRLSGSDFDAVLNLKGGRSVGFKLDGPGDFRVIAAVDTSNFQHSKKPKIQKHQKL